MKIADETDGQKLIIHFCCEAEKRGRDDAWITRDSLLDGKTIPQAAGIKLVWAALSLPKGVLEWSEDKQSFRLSDASWTSIQMGRKRRLGRMR